MDLLEIQPLESAAHSGGLLPGPWMCPPRPLAMWGEAGVAQGRSARPGCETLSTPARQQAGVQVPGEALEEHRTAAGPQQPGSLGGPRPCGHCDLFPTTQPSPITCHSSLRPSLPISHPPCVLHNFSFSFWFVLSCPFKE